MAELIPYPFPALVRRMFAELAAQGSIFQLPARRFFLGEADFDLTVDFHGHRAPSPLGPAAGPHTQMAQNLVLAWLAGGRILELKTVQILDELVIPRPCIDMRTVGFNAEWSQELKLEESLAEYVKGAMAIEMLRQSGRIPLGPGAGEGVFDLSVGYDLAGIRGDRVRAFIDGMRDARAVVERLRGELSPADLPADLAHLRDLDFPHHLSDTVTLSTFHGCPPDEIEAILEHLMDEHGLHTIVKLNPMLLGAEEARHLLHDVLGYEDLRVPDSAFARDATWEEATGMVERLAARARGLGLGFGVKLTNTLIVENNQGFLPASEREVYLSGPPLHVLAMHLVRRFRRRFGGDLPISFSAGIDRTNFPAATALGLAPITVCSDLLLKGGYGRMGAYYASLRQRMEALGARTIPELILATAGMEGEENLAAARVANTEAYVAGLAEDPRYRKAANSTPPRKIDRHLELFNCLTCDLCIPVCPNDANFTLDLGGEPIPIVKLRREEGEGAGRTSGWRWVAEGGLPLTEKHQIATFADFCNECGNCDVFCPEDGGPYKIKPRFFRRREDWRRFPELDGFQVERGEGGDVVYGRAGGREYRLHACSGQLRFAALDGGGEGGGGGFEIRFEPRDPAGTLEVISAPWEAGELDLTWCFLLDRLRQAVLDAGKHNYLSGLFAA